jgi:hypothetical protein
MQDAAITVVINLNIGIQAYNSLKNCYAAIFFRRVNGNFILLV